MRPTRLVITISVTAIKLTDDLINVGWIHPIGYKRRLFLRRNPPSVPLAHNIKAGSVLRTLTAWAQATCPLYLA